MAVVLIRPERTPNAQPDGEAGLLPSCRVVAPQLSCSGLVAVVEQLSLLSELKVTASALLAVAGKPVLSNSWLLFSRT